MRDSIGNHSPRKQAYDDAEIIMLAIDCYILSLLCINSVSSFCLSVPHRFSILQTPVGFLRFRKMRGCPAGYSEERLDLISGNIAAIDPLFPPAQLYLRVAQECRRRSTKKRLCRRNTDALLPARTDCRSNAFGYPGCRTQQQLSIHGLRIGKGNPGKQAALARVASNQTMTEIIGPECTMGKSY